MGRRARAGSCGARDSTRGRRTLQDCAFHPPGRPPLISRGMQKKAVCSNMRWETTGTKILIVCCRTKVAIPEAVVDDDATASVVVSALRGILNPLQSQRDEGGNTN